MAKFHGIGSASISGKAGGNVFAKGLDGGTIMRAYQPQVKNPNTEAQMGVRAKFKMLSVIAAGMKNALMLNTTRVETQRNAFIRVNSPAVTIRGTVAEVDAGSLVVSRGTEPLGGVPTFAAEQGVANGYVVTIPGGTANTIGYAVGVVVLDPHDGVSQVYSYYFAGSATKHITLPADNLANCRVYAYRVEAATSGAAATYGELTDNSADGDHTLMLSARRLVASGDAYPTAAVCVTPTV